MTNAMKSIIIALFAVVPALPTDADYVNNEYDGSVNEYAQSYEVRHGSSNRENDAYHKKRTNGSNKCHAVGHSDSGPLL